MLSTIWITLCTCGLLWGFVHKYINYVLSILDTWKTTQNGLVRLITRIILTHSQMLIINIEQGLSPLLKYWCVLTFYRSINFEV